MTAITCTQLSKSYGKTNALHQLDCTITADAITGLIGRNGAGKTTLLKTIAGFLQPTSGEVRVFDLNPYDNLTIAANTILIDDSMVFPESQNLGQILTIAGMHYPLWDQALAEKLLDYFNLSATKQPRELSKGMLSTFRSIIGICARVPLTLMDEPTSGMDATARQDFYRALLKDYVAHPRTIVLSSHLLGEIEDLLEYILLIDRGTDVLSAPVLKLQHYALSLSGPAQDITPLLEKRTILSQETPLHGHITATIINDLTSQELSALNERAITIKPLSANDLCVLLTQSHKGGIDHVFE